MGVSVETYRRVVLEDPTGGWELECGQLRRKPDVTTEDASVIEDLDYQVQTQMDRDEFAVRSNNGRLEHALGGYYVPDLCIIPRALVRRLLAQPRTFEEYTEPMPFVAEVWSPSTGTYDLRRKIEQYRQRGDQEIWRIHPYQRTVTAWRRQPDGGYREETWSTGAVALHAVPGIRIDIDRLFRFASV